MFKRIRNSTILCFLIAALLFTACYTSFASTAAFIVSHKPPPNFVINNSPETILIDVYYADRYLGSYKATVSPNFVKFYNPSAFLTKINNLSKRKEVRHALLERLAPHTDLICNQLTSQSSCGTLTPKIAGIIYDPTNFRAHLFINTKDMTINNKQGLFLPDSTAGPSYYNQLFAVSSNSSGPNESHYYNVTTNNTVAFGNTRFNLSASFANDLFGKNDFQVNEANIEKNVNQWIYSLGILESQNSLFFSNLTILEAKARTSLDTVPSARYGASTPLSIFVPTPGVVSIFKDGRLIYARHLLAGYQAINTAGFPEGAYQLTIKMTNVRGSTTTRQQYFVKTDLIPPPGMPQYYVAAGFLMGIRQLDTTTFKPVLGIPVYQLGYGRRLSNRVGLKLSLTGTDRDAYLTAGPSFLGNHYQFQSSFLAGTDGSAGLGGTLTYQHRKIDLALSVLKVFASNRDDTNVSSNTKNYYNRILTLTDFQSNVTLNYQLNNGVVTLFGSYNKTVEQPRTFSYGADIEQQVAQISNMSVNLNLSANRSETDYTVLASLSLHFNSEHFNSFGEIGYIQQRYTEKQMGNAQNDDDIRGNGVLARGAANWSNYDANQHGYDIGINGNLTPITKNAGVTYNYTNRFTQLNAFASYNHSQDLGDYAQYGGSIDTRFAWTPSSGAAISGDSLGTNAGVIVRINDNNPDAKFEVYSSHYLHRIVRADENVFLPLPPYQNYTIQVVNASKQLCKIKKPTQRVTLYPGNVQFIHWHALNERIIIGRLINNKGKAMADTFLKGSLGFTTSDDDGYFQVCINKKSHTKIIAEQGKKKCVLQIPSLSSKKSYIYLGDVKCSPTN